MLHGGVDPGLLDEVQRWRTDDLWYWSLEALAVYVRAAAERSKQTVEFVCRRIADTRGITLVKPSRRDVHGSTLITRGVNLGRSARRRDAVRGGSGSYG